MRPPTTPFALMVQTLTGTLTPPEPARPGPSRVHRWLGDEAEDARTLDGGHCDAPAVTDTGAKLIASLITTAAATNAQHPARAKLTEIDAAVDGANAGGGASPAWCACGSPSRPSAWQPAPTMAA